MKTRIILAVVAVGLALACWGWPVAEVTIATCTFTGSAGTDLNAITPDLGSAFARHSSFSGNPIVLTDANRARNNGGATDVALYYNQTAPAAADYKVGTTWRKLSAVSNHYAGIAGRIQTGSFSLYMCAQNTPGTWTLAKIVNGVYTALPGATYSHSPSLNTDYVIELVFSGSTIKFLLDGVEVISATDSAISAKGFGGLVSYVGVTNSTGIHYDDFYIKEEQASHPVGTEAVTIADSGFQLSPWNWRPSGDSRIAINPGAYLKRRVKSTYLALNLDVSAMVSASLAANRYPVLLFRIDDGEWESHQIASAPDFHVVFEGLADEFHDVEIIVNASDAFTARWNETSAVIIDSVQMDTGWETDDFTEPTDTILFYGDSITEGAGLNGAATNGAQYVAFASAVDGYAAHIARGLNAKDGRVAFGGTSWSATWNSDVPPFVDTWDFYSSGNSRLTGGLLTPEPTWILVAHGTNVVPDGSPSSGTVVADFLTALRAAAPGSKIVVLVPFGQATNAVTYIPAGFSSYQTATPDSQCKLINLGAIDGIGPAVTGTATFKTTDGLHPNTRTHAELAAQIVAEIKEAFAVPGGVPRSRLINAGGN